MTALALLADLADYPGAGLAGALEACPRALTEASPVVRELLAEFTTRACALTPARREEIYTASFDLQPDCTLNLGHHLFGEDWKRSSMLIELAPIMRRAGLETGGELPDHLCWLLRLLARSPGEAEVRDLVPCVVLPGLRSLRSRLPEEHPYQPLLQALYLLLGDGFPCAEAA